MITGRTLDAYARRGHQLLARCASDIGNPEPSAAAFADWLAPRRPELRTATWHAYRAAACHLLEGHPDPGAPAAIVALRAVAAPPGPRPPRRSSARRAKRLPPEDLLAILGELGRSRSKHAGALRTWLIASILTGLRPCEWSAASLEGRTLTVNCAKFSEGWRGLDETRTLVLAGLGKDDLGTVRSMCNLGAAWAADGNYARMQTACAELLRAVNIALWPTRLRRVTLYTCRHIFVANAKAGGADQGELAALLGHVAARSAFRSYGKTRDGWERGRPPIPQAPADAVARVRPNGPAARPAAEHTAGS